MALYLDYTVHVEQAGSTSPLTTRIPLVRGMFEYITLERAIKLARDDVFKDPIERSWALRVLSSPGDS